MTLIQDGPFAGMPRNHARVIYADPPWHFKTRSDKGSGRSASAHYPVMGMPDLLRMPVRDLAAEHCVLFMWVIDSHVHLAMDLVKAWGFTYKTVGFYWAKQNAKADGMFMGSGFWTRANSEHCFEAYLGDEQEAERCFLATVGKPKRDAKDVRRLILSPRREHSRKPDEVYPAIERLVSGPYVELFARQERPGWIAWGNETGRFPAKHPAEHPAYLDLF